MPIRRLDESEVRRITEKYVHSVRRDPNTVPNIHDVIKEAIQKAAPNRDLDPQDVESVLSKLAKKNTINDKVISEAAKEVVDRSAMEDLKHMVKLNAEKLNHRDLTDVEIEQIIAKKKLNPIDVTLPQIRKAVEEYFTGGGRPLEYYSTDEIQTMIRKEMSKDGAVDDRDVKIIFAKYMEQADQDKPVDLKELQAVIKTYTDSKPPRQPQGPEAQPRKHGEDKPLKVGVKEGKYVPPKDPAHMTFFEKIRYKFRRYGIKSLTKESRNWLTDEVSQLKRVNRQKFLREGESLAQAMIGNMFMYFYDAKTKKDLPYWDKFPLIFPIELYKDGWLGINLHYLPIDIRMKLFDKLLAFANDKSLDKITKLRLSYGLLKNVSKFPEVRPCIKRYLGEFVKSNLLRVEPIDWEIALFLPVEQFQKERKEQVWIDSKRKISRLRRRR